MPYSLILFYRYMYVCASIGYAEVPPSRVWCQWPRSGSAGSRQLQSGLSAAVPPVLHAVSGSPPPPACLCEICAKYQPGPACPPHAWLSELSSWSLSLGAARLSSLSLAPGPRQARAEADQAQASTATYLPSSPSQTTAKSFTQHSKF